MSFTRSLTTTSTRSLTTSTGRRTACWATPREDGGRQKARIVIRYCTGCNWMLRSTYLASELLTTFKNELVSSRSEIALQPLSEPAGVFQVLLNEEKIWDRTDVDENGVRVGFPDVKILKQLVRDRLVPDKSLGHSDNQ